MGRWWRYKWITFHPSLTHTGEVVDKQLRSKDFLTFFSNREPCLIGMEACGGSQHWARELKKLGHEVRLLQARFVKAFVMGNKNDVMDARAIWMAVQQPSKEIAVKTEEQQSVLVLHRSRRQLVKFRTAQINALHGTLLEFGETLHKGRAAMDRELPVALERMKTKLPPYLITVLEDQYTRLSELDMLIDDLEKQLNSAARQSETCKRLMEIPGVGPLIATAAVATMGKASAFKSGREFAAYVGLVPKQTGSGGKVRMLGISKRGGYLPPDIIYSWGKVGSIADQRARSMDHGAEKTAADRCGYRGNGEQAGTDSVGNSRS